MRPSGPSDAPGVRSVCTTTKIATFAAPGLKFGFCRFQEEPPTPPLHDGMCSHGCVTGVFTCRTACLCKHRIRVWVSSASVYSQQLEL